MLRKSEEKAEKMLNANYSYKKPSSVQRVFAIRGRGSDRVQEIITFTNCQIYGSGAFGNVYLATLCPYDTRIAIKRVLQDRKYRNRELQMMRALDHCNIVSLLYFFYTSDSDKKNGVYLNLVLDFMPDTLFSVIRSYLKARVTMPLLTLKLFMYQLFRALSYLHSLGICHRDIKPTNLLLDQSTGILKLCDFGSAKYLVDGEPNISYICSRYYRAPELLFGATEYTFMIDIWSTGCVFSELLRGQLIFKGENAMDHLVDIIRILGTPTKEQIHEMNKNYIKYDFPQIKAQPWPEVFPARTPTEAIELISRLFEYKPSARIKPLEACAHPFFNELREPGKKWLNNRDLPPLFNFTKQELNVDPSLTSILLPNHVHRSVGDGSNSLSSSTQSSLPLPVPSSSVSYGSAQDISGSTTLQVNNRIAPDGIQRIHHYSESL